MSKPRLKTAWMCLAGLLLASAGGFGQANGQELTLVENGVSQAPVVVSEGAPPMTRRAAEELAEYIEKVSGARPEVLEGRPDPLPQRAIWVGYQPVLDELFPDTGFDFQHPEEILIAANESHLVIAGRDRWNPDFVTVEGRNWTIEGFQHEYGTANAVYTFLQDYLDVRWVMPGEVGVDILPRETIAFAPFEYRYHPQFRLRSNLFRLSERGDSRGISHDWVRYQRLQLDSQEMDTGGHMYSYFWDRYHETDPDMFAFQPDGTRSGFPGPTLVKRCKSNPRVWETWLDYVEEELERNPHRRVFRNGTNDSHNRGHCVCQNCLAWDHPDAPRVRYSWEGLTQEYVALSDRMVTFVNHLAQGLKERFPDRDDLYVTVGAYGNYRTAPVAARLEHDNILVSNVAYFFGRRGQMREDHMEEFRKWSEITSEQVWRPNLGGPLGWHQGLPEVALRQAMVDFRFVAEHSGVGLAFDTIWENWATKAPLYYLMGQMAWDPYQDGEAILKDFYQRAYGPAAAPMEAYWTLLEETRERHAATVERPGLMNLHETYDEALLGRAASLLEEAARAVEADSRHRERIKVAEIGFEHTSLVADCARLIPVFRAGGDDAPAAEARLRENWQRLNALGDEHPVAFRSHPFRLDSLHPDSYK